MKYWIMAIRPKTLTASLSPVVLGLALCVGRSTELDLLISVLTMLCALFLQISSNLINDYYDGIKGTDKEDRLGPKRVTAEGLIPADKVKKAFLITLSLSALLGLFLVYKGGLSVFIIAICSLLFAYAYTGGPFPLSYYGLGEIFAFIFFGPIAVWGTCYLQTGNFYDLLPIVVGSGPGFISATLMSVNNLRDIESDLTAKKFTLASYFGKDFGRMITIFLVICSSFIPIVTLTFLPGKNLILLASFSCYLFAPVWKNIILGPIDSSLNRSLAATGAYMSIYSLLFSIGLTI